MTPLFRNFDRKLPRWLTYATLITAYSLMLAAIVLSDPPYAQEPIIYIDVTH